MSAKYLLPCKCGQRHEVDVSQSGLTIECSCGAGLEVPTLRGLQKLERAGAEGERRRFAWGAREGTIVIGILITAAGLGLAIWFLLTPPKHPSEWVEVASQRMPSRPAELFRAYVVLKKNGFDDTIPPVVIAHERYAELYQVGTVIFFVIAGVGVLTIVLAFVAYGPSQRPRR
ncbi:MAG: hypothetical protein HYS13_08740 [Planctomycetia bacterium]|nr:hypothetical protein [Planctomycetia bacterium]